MDLINVNLGERSYPIYIGKDILQDLGSTLKKYSAGKKVTIVTNSTVAPIYLKGVEDSLKKNDYDVYVIELPDGEAYKSLAWAGKIFDKLISFGMDRYSCLIALGGGVIGDITGFAAATFLRGIPYVQAPTTLLAQVDSSVGGKTAVNHRRGKNLIGAFYQPKFVYIDIDTLKTLELRELKAGLAEVIKYGVIRDENLFSYLENNIRKILSLDDEALYKIIKRSCEIKAEIVAEDERESGLRAILNFGHTFGHAVETVTKYKEYKHGEAVAIGMSFASKLSYRLGYCTKEHLKRLDELIKLTGLSIEVPSYSAKDYLKAISLDKKAVAGNVNFVLMKKLGQVQIESVREADYGCLLRK